VVVRDHGGRFPADVAGLQKLPGIGPYTAGAIAAIAFDVPVAAVDGNVERVLARLFALDAPLPQIKPRIRLEAARLVPQQRAGDFTQALMDLGATICTPKSPACGICPWTEHCVARRKGIAATLPRRLPKPDLPTRKGYAYWIMRKDGRVLLRQRPEKGLLGGMLEVPTSEWTHRLPRDFAALAPVTAEWKSQPGVVKHIFTHFRLELTLLATRLSRTPRLGDDFRWVGVDELAGEALPSVMRKVVAKNVDQRLPPTSSMWSKRSAGSS
jgi:A/G-specific adenine glycosylase